MDYTVRGTLQARTLSLLQGIFPAQGSNPGLPHCRWILYQLSHQGSQVPSERVGTLPGKVTGGLELPLQRAPRQWGRGEGVTWSGGRGLVPGELLGPSGLGLSRWRSPVLVQQRHWVDVQRKPEHRLGWPCVWWGGTGLQTGLELRRARCLTQRGSLASAPEPHGPPRRTWVCVGPQEWQRGRWVTLGAGRVAGFQGGLGMGTEVNPNWPVRQGLEALAATDPEHIKNLGKEQELVSCQDKWHKAHACFHSL